MKFREESDYGDQVLGVVSDIAGEADSGKMEHSSVIVRPNLGELEFVAKCWGNNPFIHVFNSFELSLHGEKGIVADFTFSCSEDGGWRNYHRESHVKREGLGWFMMDVAETIIARSRRNLLSVGIPHSCGVLKGGGGDVGLPSQPDTFRFLVEKGFRPMDVFNQRAFDLCVEGCKKDLSDDDLLTEVGAMSFSIGKVCRI